MQTNVRLKCRHDTHANASITSDIMSYSVVPDDVVLECILCMIIPRTKTEWINCDFIKFGVRGWDFSVHALFQELVVNGEDTTGKSLRCRSPSTLAMQNNLRLKTCVVFSCKDGMLKSTRSSVTTLTDRYVINTGRLQHFLRNDRSCTKTEAYGCSVRTCSALHTVISTRRFYEGRGAAASVPRTLKWQTSQRRIAPFMVFPTREGIPCAVVTTYKVA